MDKQLLIEVLRNYTAASDAEANEIISLKNQFPFSQALQVLAAKVSKDRKLASQQSELQMAAVYTADRSHLKEIMTMDLVKPSIVPVEPEQTHVSVSITISETTVPQKPTEQEQLVAYEQIEKTIEDIDVADMIIRDLKRLTQLKHNFEMLFADESTVSIPVTAPEKSPSETPVPGESFKSRRARIIELAKEKNAAHDHTESPVVRKKRKDQSDLIEEIKTSKDEIEPGNERLKEQIELIDHFIKTQPSIPNVKERNPLPPTDLNAIKSGEFGENIVSETLVEILIKQGKKERAIEVLKKLIWKYPQKKAYFASQIEDLKK